MPKDDFKHKQVVVYLTVEQKAVLDAVCNETGLNKSEAIRQALKMMIPTFPDDMPTKGENLKGSDNYNKTD